MTKMTSVNFNLKVCSVLCIPPKYTIVLLECDNNNCLRDDAFDLNSTINYYYYYDKWAAQ